MTSYQTCECGAMYRVSADDSRDYCNDCTRRWNDDVRYITLDGCETEQNSHSSGLS